MNNGYEKSKGKLQAYNLRAAASAKARRETWQKACKGCTGSISYENRRNQFCTHACAARFHNTQRFPTRAALTKSPATPRAFEELKTDSSRRQRLIKELGYVCQVCGLTEWRGQPTPVVMDHIDGNPDNNVRGNLRLVCPNCNAQLPTFSGKNKGRGRTARRLKRQSDTLARLSSKG